MHLLASETSKLAASVALRRSDQAAVWVSSSNTRRLLLYVRALRYLREHGIAPAWPLHRRAPVSVEAQYSPTSKHVWSIGR